MTFEGPAAPHSGYLILLIVRIIHFNAASASLIYI